MTVEQVVEQVMADAEKQLGVRAHRFDNWQLCRCLLIVTERVGDCASLDWMLGCLKEYVEERRDYDN